MSLLASLGRILPPPSLIRIGGVAIDISDSSVKYLSLKPNGIGSQDLSIKHFGEIKIDSNIISRGDINDAESLVKILREIKKKTKADYCRLSLPEERVYFFELEISKGLPYKELRHQIEFKLEENIPISPRDSYFDFEVVEELSPSTDRVVVAVCPKEIINKYYEVCKLAKLTPLSFEAESGAIARAVLSEDNNSTNLIIDIGRAKTSFSIVEGVALSYTSTIDIGCDDFLKSLKKQFPQSSDEALEKLKYQIGLIKGVDGKDPSESLLPLVSTIKDEIKTRIQYWDSRSEEANKIDKIIVCGGGANIRGLTNYLTETIGIETRLANVWQNVFDYQHLIPPIKKEDSYAYATTIGLALTSFSDFL